MLFLELGVVPFREIIRKRRLSFLYYILHERRDSMIRKVFETQRKNSTSKDWVTTVLIDMKEIDLNLKCEEIENMKKDEFMNKVKRKIYYKTLKDLEQIKGNHSKVRTVQHPVLKL